MLRLPPHAQPPSCLARLRICATPAVELEGGRFDQRHRWDRDVCLDAADVDVASEVVALPEGGEATESEGEAFGAIG